MLPGHHLLLSVERDTPLLIRPVEAAIGRSQGACLQNSHHTSCMSAPPFAPDHPSSVLAVQLAINDCVGYPDQH